MAKKIIVDVDKILESLIDNMGEEVDTSKPYPVIILQDCRPDSEGQLDYQHGICLGEYLMDDISRKVDEGGLKEMLEPHPEREGVLYDPVTGFFYNDLLDGYLEDPTDPKNILVPSPLIIADNGQHIWGNWCNFTSATLVKDLPMDLLRAGLEQYKEELNRLLGNEPGTLPN